MNGCASLRLRARGRRRRTDDGDQTMDLCKALTAIATAGLAATLMGAHAREASSATRAANAAAATALPVDDGEDDDFATRGFLAGPSQSTILRADGGVAWDFRTLAVSGAQAPDTAHPSLWRHARLLARHGLFKLADRLYQVRGFDVSNLSVIVGETGYILVDPLTTSETAGAAMALVRAHLGDRPVRAVIYSHSHADHFGGVKGVVDPADVAAGRIEIIAPEHFLEHAVGENVIAGNAMSRRAAFQFGAGLAAGPQGSLGSGIGPAIPAGTVTLLAPTHEVKATGETMMIDGVAFEFQMTPGTEAPSEMNFYLPQFRALFMAENANVTMHNILTPRGALVRDAKAWADQLSQSLRLYGGRSDIMFTAHGWPRFGQTRIADFLASHRDAYKYLHDQSVRLMNQGLTGPEIAETIALPPGLAARWFNRGYYGTMEHNSRAVYQRYMGWYDANPAHLNPLPPEESARRTVAAMGGARRVERLAKAAMDKGDYRWASELLDKAVFADGSNRRARQLLAEAHRQLAFQSESAIWRNMYLRAALELSAETPPRGEGANSQDLVQAATTRMLFDLMAVRLDPAKAGAASFSVAFVFPERNERVHAAIRNGVLVPSFQVDDPADVTVTMPRALLLRALAGAGLPAAGPAGAQVDGDRTRLGLFLSLFDTPDPAFAIVTP